MWELAILMLLGLLAATVSAMSGVGGGLLFVPILTLAYGFSPSGAVGTSLTVIIFTALSASFGYARQKKIYYKTGAILALMTVPGTLVGAYLTSVLPEDVLGLAFGVFLIFVAIRMVFETRIWQRKNLRNSRKCVSCEAELWKTKGKLAASVSLGFFGGLVSGLLGVGGGILLVPIMALLLRMPMHSVVATSMFTMIFTSLAGASQHWFLGNVNLVTAVLLAIGALVGAQIGAWMVKRTSPEKISLIFAVLVLVVSIQMIIKFV